MQKKNPGEMIRTVRKENKDTLKQLAEKIGYDVSNLSKVERGKYGASMELLWKIAKVYKLDPGYFLDDFFTESESEFFSENNLHLPDLKEKYHFVVDGKEVEVEASDKEIMEALRLIHYLRGE